ncbi:glutamate-rich protein 1 isoform X2 [Bufo gargarizans]|uniref:glutamate-rich protein 1 isoform X2 n=1 Tax=Bufo gargarizans TaxID=30331 RepID=UPI001CF478DB|nr:glutamate-rich protein 1 isoform X2 [Bufo gargarizans]
MSSARREVLLSKVLTRLYPTTADGQTVASKNETLPTGTGEKSKEMIQPSIPEPAGIQKLNLSDLKVYTVSLPPDDYIPPPATDLNSPTTEDSDVEEDQPVEIRKRRRRKKKVNIINKSSPDREQNVQQAPHPQVLDGKKINKNKKRKLQRKRQKARLKAEGLWTKQRTCHPEVSQAKDHTVNQSDEKTEEDQIKKREDLLEFFQDTQELYFSNNKYRRVDSALMVEQILEILDQIKSGAVPFSEIQLLHHVKSLLLLQDIERLKDSLDSFKEQSSMTLDHRTALCSLFDYWITNILPIKTKSTE